MSENTDLNGVFLNYPETILYPAGGYSELDMLRLEWPKTGLVLDFYLASEKHCDEEAIASNVSQLKAESYHEPDNISFGEWSLRGGLDMTREEEQSLTHDDWAAIRDIIRAAVDRHQMNAGQRGLFDGRGE